MSGQIGGETDTPALLNVPLDAKSSSDTTVTANIVGDNMFHWQGVLKGPEDTPYHTGVYNINIEIPDDYPYNPPKMKFTTKIWHPNISSQTWGVTSRVVPPLYTCCSEISTLAKAMLGLHIPFHVAEAFAVNCHIQFCPLV